jgi:hypothetical protein
MIPILTLVPLLQVTPAVQPCDSLPPIDAQKAITLDTTVAGDYEVTLVSTWEELAGTITSGRLRLRPASGPARDRGITLIGAASVPLSPVGAVANGDLTSLNPSAPGAVVSGLRIEIGVCPLRMVCGDIQSTLLTVDWIGAHGFGGRWTTDLGFLVVIRDGKQLPNPGGYFCAVRS